MAIAVSKTDLINGQTATLTEDGWQITRIFKVTGLTGTTANEKAVRAVDAVMTAGTLVIGSTAYPYNLRGSGAAILRSLTPVYQSDDVFNVVAAYSKQTQKTIFPAVPVIEAGASVMQEESNIDINGNLVTLEYTYSNSNRGVNTGLAGTTQTASEPISVYKPQSQYVVRISKTSNPTSDSIAFVGKINSNSGFITSGDQYKWLCTSITGTSNDNGVTWDVTRQFQFNSEGWNNRKILYRDDTTGKIPADVLSQAGAYKTPEMYASINMSGLLS